jgi:hypothetical protein
MASKALSKTSRVERNQNIAKGLRAACPKASIPVNGKMVKVADIAELLDQGTDAENKVVESRAAYRVDVKLARGIEEQIEVLLQPVKTYVQSHFGEDSKVSAACGFAARKIGKVSAEKRAEAVAKLRATREARMTMGPRQKAQIHGEPAAAPTPQPQPAQTNDEPADATDGSQSSVLSLNGKTH